MAQVTLARRLRRAHSSRAFSQELTEDATMPRVKQASKQKRKTKAAAGKALGAAGLSFSLVGNNASASTMPTADIPQSDNNWPSQRFVLSEEEMGDVSLATFHLFDRENLGSGVRLARGGGGGGGGLGPGGGGRGGVGAGSAGVVMVSAPLLAAEVAVVAGLLAPGVALVAGLLAPEVAVVAGLLA